MLTRRGFLLGSVLAVAGQALARPIRGSRAAPSNSIVPNSPLWDTLTGGSGQFVAVWYPVTHLVGGSTISNGPLTTYTVKIGSTEAKVSEGGTPDITENTSNTTLTRTGLSAGGYWVSLSASNAAGESSFSFPLQVTVT